MNLMFLVECATVWGTTVSVNDGFHPKASLATTVLRQNLIRVENGLIPRWNDLNMTRELNQKASPIG